MRFSVFSFRFPVPFLLILLSLSLGCITETDAIPRSDVQEMGENVQVPIDPTSGIPADTSPIENASPVGAIEPNPFQISNEIFQEITFAPEKEELHEGNLVISDGTYFINNTRFTLRGNLIVNGTGHLIVRDSELHFDQEYNQQYRAYILENASLTMDNVRLRTDGKWFNFQYGDSARVYLNDVHGEDCCIPWHGSGGNVRFAISNSTVGLTLSENVHVQADKSSLFFELVLTDVSGFYELPSGKTASYYLDMPKGDGTRLELNTTDSTFTDWGVTLDKYTDVTFANSKMTIGLNAGSDWTSPERASPHVQVSGLKNQLYDNFTLDYDTNRLHLINTYVRDWYPQAWNNATVEISDSDLADLQFNGGTSTLIVRNSRAMIAIARENVTYFFYNSTIQQDAIAHDDARIYLYNTSVGGVVKEIGNGKVFADRSYE